MIKNKKLQEFKDDAEADAAVDSVTSSLKNLLKYVNNPVDFSRLMEAVMKWMIRNKPALSTVDKNTNYTQVMNYLNKMQAEKTDAPVDKTAKPAAKPVAKPTAQKP